MKSLETKFPPPLVGLIFIGISTALTYLMPGFNVISKLPASIPVMLLIPGFGLPIAGSLSFRRARTTINPLNPEQASTLVKEGVFRLTRNPMYLGMASLTASWAIYPPFSDSWESLALYFTLTGFKFCRRSVLSSGDSEATF